MRLFRTTVSTASQRQMGWFTACAFPYLRGFSSSESRAKYWAGSFALFLSGLSYYNFVSANDRSKYLPGFFANVMTPVFGKSAPFLLLPTQRKGDPFLTFPAISERPAGEGRVAEEKLVEDALEVMPASRAQPNMFPISDILSWVEGVALDTDQPMTCCIITECNSLDASAFPCMDGSIRQVASQFDSGESMYYHLTHPSQFKIDPTQGPSEQRNSYTAALARWIYRDYCDCLSRLEKYPEFDQCFDYRFGRLTPRLGREEQGLRFLQAHVNEIRLNVQRVGIDGTQNTAIQVLNAGMALGSFDDHSEKRSASAQKAIFQMSNLLLTAEYKAVAAVAIAEARKYPEKEIPVSFTLVGAGMFGNDKQAVQNGINAACDLIEKSGVRNVVPCLSVFFADEVDEYRTGYFQNAPVLVGPEALSKLSRLSEAEKAESESVFMHHHQGISQV